MTKFTTSFQCTKLRGMLINKRLLRGSYTLAIYTGKSKSTNKIKIRRNFIGHHFGEFTLTKALGHLIHDSERNRKKHKKKQHK